MAVANLREAIINVLANDEGVHVETLMTTLGALQGFASQNAALKEVHQARKDGEVVPETAVALVKTVDEKRFLFGDWINESIFFTEENDLSLERVVFGSVSAMGVELSELVNPAELAGEIADRVGTSDFGSSTVLAEHTPHQTAYSLLKDTWQLFTDIMELDVASNDPKANEEPPLDEDYWPAVATVVIAQFLEMTKDVLDARISVHLLMESAIMMAKVDPALIAGSRWDVSEFDGGLLVNPKTLIAN